MTGLYSLGHDNNSPSPARNATYSTYPGRTLTRIRGRFEAFQFDPNGSVRVQEAKAVESQVPFVRSPGNISCAAAVALGCIDPRKSRRIEDEVERLEASTRGRAREMARKYPVHSE